MHDEQKRELNAQLNNSHGSYELVLSPAIFALIGFWLDGRIGTTPWITVTFAVAGFAGAATMIYLKYRAKMAVLHEERLEKSAMTVRTSPVRDARPLGGQP